MITTDTFPVLQDTDTVYTLKQYSELMAAALNGGKSPYRPDVQETTAPNYTSTGAVSTPAWIGGSEITFKAKKHGSAWITLSGLARTAVADYQIQMLCEIRTGLSGGGSRVHISAAVTEGLIWYNASNWVQSSKRYLVTGLTPGMTYYARPMVTCDYANAKLNYGNLKVDF